MDKQLPKMEISNKVVNIPEALSVYINNIVYQLKRDGHDMTVMSLGEAFFDIPSFDLNAIDIKKGYHYSESLGIPELRECIAQYYKDSYGASINPDKEILISAGSKPLVFMALQTILNQDDEVLLHEPAWLSYPEQIKLAGGKVNFIPYDVDVDNFIEYVTNRTKAIILNNPNNPAGTVYSREKLKKLYPELRSRGIYLIVDEAYSDFVLDDSFASMADLCPNKDGVIIINSLSKNLGMSGWRIGYAISNDEVIHNMLKLNQHLITCPATVLCLYVAKYFNEIREATFPQVKAVVEKKNTIKEYMSNIGIDIHQGASTFYIFVSIAGYGHSSLDFALYLLFKYHIAVVPGSAYGASTDSFIRVGVGAETSETLKEALTTIKTVIDNKEFDQIFIETELERLHIKKFEN